MFQTSLSSLRSLILPTAVLGAVAWAPTLQAEDSFAFLDLRLSYSTMPTDGYDGGPEYNIVDQQGDFEKSHRISLMMIGPLCAIIPVGCGSMTEAYTATGPSRSASSDFDMYDDLGDFTFTGEGSSFDLLMGVEFSLINLESKGRPSAVGGLMAPWIVSPVVAARVPNPFAISPFEALLTSSGRPQIQIDTLALTGHFGWGIAITPFRTGVMHFELTGFGGLGYSTVEWIDPLTYERDEVSGLYYEIGARLGAYYTFDMGLQVGVDFRLLYADHSMQVFSRSTDLSIAGAAIGAQLGWRF